LCLAACLIPVMASLQSASPDGSATQPEPSIGASLGAAASPQLYSRFIGSWNGKLEYRDFSDAASSPGAPTPKRVTLPTMLDVMLSAAGDAMVFHYTYDDGPGKTVQDRETVSLSGSLSRYLEVSEDGKERSEFHATGLSSLQGEAPAHVVLEGKGEENGKAVDVRTTIDINYRTFTILRETRQPGQEFLFRHQYSFERVASAKPVK